MRRVSPIIDRMCLVVYGFMAIGIDQLIFIHASCNYLLSQTYIKTSVFTPARIEIKPTYYL